MRTKRKISFFLLFIFDIIKLAVIAFVIVWPIHHFLFQPFYVVGSSMEPNFYDKDYLIVGKINYRFDEPKRGHVVIFHPPANDKNYLIKRIVGLPNEKIFIEKGEVYIANSKFSKREKLDERAYLPLGLTTPGKVEVQLKDDEYYVLGDNRNMSMDSRSFGAIKKNRIVGKVVLRGWPFDRFELIKAPSVLRIGTLDVNLR